MTGSAADHERTVARLQRELEGRLEIVLALLHALRNLDCKIGIVH